MATIDIVYGGKILNTSDEVINFNSASGTFTDFFSTVIAANDPSVIDGRELILQGYCVFNKTTSGSSSYEVEFNIGGTSITTTTFSVGVGTISNQTHFFELRINFRSANSSRVYACYKRQNSSTELASYTPNISTVAFDKTIANTISVGIRIVSNDSDNDMTRELTSLIIR